MKTDNLAELIKSRRSIRSWQNKPVDVNLLLEAIELATYAPNGGNQQNWRFYIIVKQEVIRAIADAVQSSADLFASWPEAARLGEATSRILQRSSFFRNAPAAIAVASSAYQSPVDQILASRGKDDLQAVEMRKWRNIANTRIQSVASAIAYLLLALHKSGLGAVWMTGPIQAKGEIEKILKIQSPLDLIAFIPVGYPSENPSLRERKPLKEVCEIIQ